VESIRRLTPQQLFAGVVALILIGLVFADLLNGSDAAQFVIVSVVVIAISAFLVLWLVPREENQPGVTGPARTSLILGILSLITLIGYWTALPFALGVPALYLGAVGQARARDGRDANASDESEEANAAESESERTASGEAQTGTALGATALVLGLLLCIIG
jgi:hypothetical protein